MDKFRIEIPEFSLVAMIGATSSGKTSFALKHFKPTEVLSSDFFRGMVSDDENDQGASNDAFDLLHYAANKRLNNMKLTVIDATNIQEFARKQIITMAREQNVHSVAIVLNLPEALLQLSLLLRDHPGFADAYVDLAYVYLLLDPANNRELALGNYKAGLERGVKRDGRLEKELDVTIAR